MVVSTCFVSLHNHSHFWSRQPLGGPAFALEKCVSSKTENPDIYNRCFVHCTSSPDLYPRLLWPTFEEIGKTQSLALEKEDAPTGLDNITGICELESEETWIPSSARKLQLRICIIGNFGRRAIEAWKPLPPQ